MMAGIKLYTIVAFVLYGIGIAQAQTNPEPLYEIRFVNLGDLRMHYLNFSWEGLPLIFIHGAARGAITWKDFAPEFTDQNRVLAAEYLKGNKSITVPALTFISSSTGTRGIENMNMPLTVASYVSKEGADWIEDDEARQFFIRLIEVEDYEEQLRKSWSNLVIPWVRQKEEAFQQAFGYHLKMIPLDLPFITGYEYMNAPDLIYHHVSSFLKDINLRETQK